MVGADESTTLDGPWDGPAGIGVCISAIGPGPTASGVATDFRVGGGGSGFMASTYLPTPNIVFFLVFRPLDFVSVPTT